MAVTIWRGVLIRNTQIEIGEILDTLQPHIAGSDWDCDILECVGIPTDNYAAARRLYKVSEDNIHISSETLSDIIENVLQIIDGDMYAYRENETNPWIWLGINDGWYEVLSNAETILSPLREPMFNAEDLSMEHYLGNDGQPLRWKLL